VKLIRERKKVSKDQLARRSGFSERWISDVEAGKSDPTWADVRKLAKSLQVSVEELAQESERIDGELWQ
jgi:transcriptional regulator with XRE-family HTH domain